MYNSLFFRVFMDLYSHHHNFPTLILIYIHHNWDSCINKRTKKSMYSMIIPPLFYVKKEKGIINWYIELWVIDPFPSLCFQYILYF